MKHANRFLALLTLILANSLAAQGGPPVRSDSARLQGAWTMIAGAAGGVPLPASNVSSMRRVLAGNHLTVTMGGQLYFSATIVLDPTKSPRTIDYRMTGGTTAGAIQRGIYTFSADTVRFCFGAPNAPRPTEFRTVAGDGNTLSTWVSARP